MELQIIYLAIKVEDIILELKDGYDYIVKDETGSVHQHYWSDGEFYAPKGKKVINVLKEQKAIIFTPEQYKQHLLDIQNKVLEEFKEVCICFKTPCICCDTVNSTQQSITSVFEQLIKEI
jgi:hypothetical protein